MKPIGFLNEYEGNFINNSVNIILRVEYCVSLWCELLRQSNGSCILIFD